MSIEEQASSLKPQVSTVVYEVFRREKEGCPMVHAGNVAAANPDLALIYAREVYGRRGESSVLWIAPREAFQVLDNADLLHPALPRTYRLVEGYRMRDKLRAVQERLRADDRRLATDDHMSTGD